MSSVYKLCIGARIHNPVVPSSIQRVAGRHIPFPQRGLHSKTRLLKLLSVVLQTWPVHSTTTVLCKLLGLAIVF